jgi:hypothetical protein
MVPIHVGVNLFVDQCPKTWEKGEDMFCVVYASAVHNLMYAMIYTRMDYYGRIIYNMDLIEFTAKSP